jgi:hypothetical protein
MLKPYAIVVFAIDRSSTLNVEMTEKDRGSVSFKSQTSLNYANADSQEEAEIIGRELFVKQTELIDYQILHVAAFEISQQNINAIAQFARR